MAKIISIERRGNEHESHPWVVTFDERVELGDGLETLWYCSTAHGDDEITVYASIMRCLKKKEQANDGADN